MRFLALIPHRHRWTDINITRQGAVSPSGRHYYSTYIFARCTHCDDVIHRVYYRDISDEQARRWLG